MSCDVLWRTTEEGEIQAHHFGVFVKVFRFRASLMPSVSGWNSNVGNYWGDSHGWLKHVILFSTMIWSQPLVRHTKLPLANWNLFFPDSINSELRRQFWISICLLLITQSWFVCGLICYSYIMYFYKKADVINLLQYIINPA